MSKQGSMEGATEDDKRYEVKIDLTQEQFAIHVRKVSDRKSTTGLYDINTAMGFAEKQMEKWREEYGAD